MPRKDSKRKSSSKKDRNSSKKERSKMFESNDYDPQFERKLKKFLRDSAMNLAQLKKNRERKQK